MSSLKKLMGGLAIAFAFPWLFLVLVPYLNMAGIDRMQYGEEEEAPSTTFPPPPRGLAPRGAEIYARNGCAYCHTQMVRPTYAGADMWRPGWTGREGEGLARETLPYDYIGENYAHLGYRRHGPDLSNVGWRPYDEKWHHLHLFDPRAVVPVSVMPRFRHLYEVREIKGQRSKDALDVDLGEGMEDYEVVPTDDARALVAYLLSLKKDHPLPASLKGKAE